MKNKTVALGMNEIATPLLIALSIVIQGSYFPIQYVSAAVFLMLTAIYKLYKADTFALDVKLTVTGLLIPLLYAVLIFAHPVNKQTGVLESIKMLCLPLAFLIGELTCNKDRLLTGIYMGCVCTAAIGILSYVKLIAFNDAVFTSNGIIRLQSTLQYANTTAVLMGTGYFLSSYFYNTANEKVKKSIHLALGSILLTALFLTFSRITLAIFSMLFLALLVFLSDRGKIIAAIQGISCFAASLLIYKEVSADKAFTALLIVILTATFAVLIANRAELLKPKTSKRLVVCAYALVLLMPVLLILYLFSTGGIKNISFSGSTFVSRIIYMQDGAGALIKSPLLGIGAGGWESKQYSLQSAQYSVKYIHNGLVQIALDGGIVAAVLFIALLIIAYYRLIKLYIGSKEVKYIYILAVITLISLHSLFDFDLSFAAVLMILGICFSFAGKSRRLKLPKLPVYIFAAAVLSFCCYTLTTEALCFGGEKSLAAKEYKNALTLYERVEKINRHDPKIYKGIAVCKQYTSKKADEVIKNMEKAQALDPLNPSYINDLYVIAYQAKNYHEMLRLSESWIALAPKQQAPYEICLKTLEKMLSAGEINQNLYTAKKQELLKKAEMENGNTNPLSIFLEHGSKINLQN